MTAAGAHALQDRDALDLLFDEDARDARDADAAEDDDNEPDETQVVLRSGQLLAEIVLGAPERPDIDESVAKRVAQRPPERLDTRLVNAEHHLVVGAAAERQQTGIQECLSIDQHSRAETEPSGPPSRLAVENAANREAAVADHELVADRDVELGQQLGPNQRATASQQSVRVGLPVAQADHAI